MKEIKCPKCQSVFQIDDDQYASILASIKNEEFEKELNNRIKEKEDLLKKEYELDLTKSNENKNKEISDLKNAKEILEAKIVDFNKKKELEFEAFKAKCENENIKNLSEKEKEISKLKDEKTLIDKVHQAEIKQKDELIAQYKDFKLRMSTKMLGETLEQHCRASFDKIRSTSFPNAYFEKDNEVTDGTKGDFIYRDYTDDKVEFISIMFDMKNEADMTATKKKNEDFLEKLDKDRNNKKCEYAVLVSTLEADSELYNDGIVDVSYRYPKMYVIRPQYFIPLISLLRNASLNSAEYQRQLVDVKKEKLDLVNFEEQLNIFKESFGKNTKLANDKFTKSIEEIDKTITHLENIKEALIGTVKNLTFANNKLEDLNMKKLTKNSPSLKEQLKK